MTSGYFPLFRRFLESSIMEEELPTRFLWLTMLLKADRQGIVHGTAFVLSRLANMRVVEVEAALVKLQEVDPHSTTPTDEGRRVKRLGPNKWLLVNYEEYRKLAQKDRDRELNAAAAKRYRDGLAGVVTEDDRHGPSLSVMDSHGSVMDSASVSVSVSGVANKKKGGMGGRKGEIPFEEFWLPLIRKVGKAKAEKAWRNLTVKDQKAAMGVLPDHLVLWSGKERQFIPHPATWINQRRWEDELEEKKAPAEGNGEWLYETYRKSDLETHGGHSMWQAYASAASDMPPKSAPPFDDWLLESMVPPEVTG